MSPVKHPSLTLKTPHVDAKLSSFPHSGSPRNALSIIRPLDSYGAFRRELEGGKIGILRSVGIFLVNRATKLPCHTCRKLLLSANNRAIKPTLSTFYRVLLVINPTWERLPIVTHKRRPDLWSPYSHHGVNRFLPSRNAPTTRGYIVPHVRLECFPVAG